MRRQSTMRTLAAVIFAVSLFAALTLPPRAAVPDRSAPPLRSWPMFGGNPARNMVNVFEKKLPATWAVAEGKQENIKWTAKLGSRTFGSPIVASGKVFVSTNYRKDDGSNWAVLMALRETDGKLLWQNKHEHPKDFSLGSNIGGLPSTPAVAGDCIYYLVPACEIICADGSTGKVLWRYDMVKELGVFPSPGICPVTTPPLASPLIVGDLIFVATGNGINDEGDVAASKAPSFVALHKKTGKLAWQSNLPGTNIIMGGWSSPAFANVNDVPQVIFAGGDCVIYSFVPETGKLLWKCDCLPTRKKNRKFVFDSFFVGTPVIAGDRLYIGHGMLDPGRGPEASYFLCLDITKQGDVSLKSYDAKAEANKDSALIWAFGGPIVPVPEKGRRVFFGPTVSTAAVHDGLVYIPETAGYLHCLDAATGREVWQHDFKAESLACLYWVDGRGFVAADLGEIVIFAHGRTAKVLATIDFDERIQTTPVAANGVLYVMTESKLYAIANGR